MIPVTLDALDNGWWTYTVPAAQIELVVRLHPVHRHSALATTTGRTREGQALIASEDDGVVQVWFPESGACFTFPAEARRPQPGHPQRIGAVAYERACGSGQRFWAVARKGRRCR